MAGVTRTRMTNARTARSPYIRRNAGLGVPSLRSVASKGSLKKRNKSPTEAIKVVESNSSRRLSEKWRLLPLKSLRHGL